MGGLLEACGRWGAVLVVAVVVVCGGSPVAADDVLIAERTVIQEGIAPATDFAYPSLVEAGLFYLFAAVTLAAGLAICIAKNIVRMAVFLFVTLGAVAVLYFLLLANFIAVIQLIVYAGGTLILLVFGVMLTSKSPWARFDTKLWELGAAGVVCVVFAAVLLAVLLTTAWPQSAEAVTAPTVADFGRTLLTTYLVPFEAVSVLLLAVMIGAAYLARQE